MQQYFIKDKELKINDKILLDEDILYHLRIVLRKNHDCYFRLVDKNTKVFLATLKNNEAIILNELNENNELNIDITIFLSLIKLDRFELAIQKLTELGVKEIIPYKAKRSNNTYELSDKRMLRLEKIILEAAEQSHRNIIPKLSKTIMFKDIKDYMKDINYIAYENEDYSNNKIETENAKSISIVIGPEGGFEKGEVDDFLNIGFKAISLGKRILRTETAAIYLTSLISYLNQ